MLRLELLQLDVAEHRNDSVLDDLRISLHRDAGDIRLAIEPRPEIGGNRHPGWINQRPPVGIVERPDEFSLGIGPLAPDCDIANQPFPGFINPNVELEPPRRLGATPVKKGVEMESKDESLTQSVRQTAKELGIGVNQAYEAVRRGEIPNIKIGKRILVLREPLAGMECCSIRSNIASSTAARSGIPTSSKNRTPLPTWVTHRYPRQ